MFKNNIISANLKVLQNINFSNNQNYVLSKKKQKTLLSWYYTYKIYVFLKFLGLVVMFWLLNSTWANKGEIMYQWINIVLIPIFVCAFVFSKTCNMYLFFKVWLMVLMLLSMGLYYYGYYFYYWHEDFVQWVSLGYFAILLMVVLFYWKVLTTMSFLSFSYFKILFWFALMLILLTYYTWANKLMLLGFFILLTFSLMMKIWKTLLNLMLSYSVYFYKSKANQTKLFNKLVDDIVNFVMDAMKFMYFAGLFMFVLLFLLSDSYSYGSWRLYYEKFYLMSFSILFMVLLVKKYVAMEAILKKLLKPVLKVLMYPLYLFLVVSLEDKIKNYLIVSKKTNFNS